jgi:uncharacterized membrane protein YvbJ
MNIKYCPSCGHEIVNGAQFCVNCGKKLSGAQEKNTTIIKDNQTVKQPWTKYLDTPFIKQSTNQLNRLIKKNPLVAILTAVIIILLLTMSMGKSPEEAAQKAAESNQEKALKAAEESVENQIEIDGFTFVEVAEMDAVMTREENTNLQETGIFKVTGTAVLKDREGEKHNDVPFQLYVDFYDGEFQAQELVDIRYGYPLIEQL